MAYLNLSERDRLDITKLHASVSDLHNAQTWAKHLLKKKWYRRPWSRGATDSHQSAYITAIVVAYGRVFSTGRNGRKFPAKLIDYDSDDWELHERMLRMRHEIYAHSALDKWTVKPWKVDDFETTVIGEPMNIIEEADLRRLVAMTQRLRSAAVHRTAEIMAPYKTIGIPSAPLRSSIDLAMEAIGQLEVGEALALPVPEASA
jgi:hypothetical protein